MAMMRMARFAVMMAMVMMAVAVVTDAFGGERFWLPRVDAVRSGEASCVVRPLPYDAEVEWLESDGNAYIVTAYGQVGNSSKTYGFVMLDDSQNKLIDLIPVRIGAVGYMYDKVSGKLFGNAGTGSFVVGQDVRVVSDRVLLNRGEVQ